MDNIYVIVTELYESGRWYYAHYNDRNQANEECMRLNEQEDVDRFVIPASQLQDFNVQNVPDELK